MKPDRHVHTAVCLVTEQAAFLPQVLAEHGSRQCSLMHARSTGQSGSRVHSGWGGGSGQHNKSTMQQQQAMPDRTFPLLGVRVQ